MIHELLDEFPQTAETIAEQLHCDTRRVTEQIQRERNLGVPICATGEGYFLPSELSYLSEFIKRMERREKEYRKTIKALRKIEKKWAGGVPTI